MLGRFLTSTMLTGVAATAATPVFAQDEGDDSDDRIVVTGSRIARQDLAAPSPLTSVDAASLQITNTVNTEDYLNDLPQLIPSFDSTSNNPGDGTARLSLRGLGSNRTLILLDGKRMVTEGISQVVDINNIPAALVERIEVVTGGASAVYGSDAIAGVVNYILKDDFEGAEINATYRLTGKGDAQVLNLSAVLGGNFADDKGNAVMAISYTDRKPLLQGERDFSSLTLFDNGPGNPFGTSGSSSIPEGRFRGASSSSFGGLAPACPPGNSCSGAIVLGPTLGLAPFRFGTPTDPANDFYNYAPTNYLQLPQERYNISAFAEYEIFDGVEAYARGLFSHVLVDQQLAPTPVVSEGPGSGPLSRASIVAAAAANRLPLARQSGFLVVETNNPFLSGGTASPAGLALGALIFGAGNASGLLGDTNGNGAAEYLFRVRKRYEEVGPRNSLRDTNTFLVGGGLRGDLGANDQWKWDAYVQYGRSAVNLVQTGNVSRGALFDAVLAGTLNLFDGPGSIQPDQAALISRTGAIQQITENVQAVATVSGETGMQMPWANRPVGAAVGVEYREEASLQQPDSVLGPDVAGFNQSVFVQGRYDVYEAFGEVDIPLISDVPFIQDFSINGGYRYSDYSTVGNVSSFFVGGSWQMIDDLRIRAQFQRAVRAPNISELFIAPANGFPGVADPCDGAVFGNWNFLSAAQQATVSANCVADGVPLADVGGFLQNNGQVETVVAGFGSAASSRRASCRASR
jgi:outer membrane receptor protein involved in Fe transport